MTDTTVILSENSRRGHASTRHRPDPSPGEYRWAGPPSDPVLHVGRGVVRTLRNGVRDEASAVRAAHRRVSDLAHRSRRLRFMKGHPNNKAVDEAIEAVQAMASAYERFEDRLALYWSLERRLASKPGRPFEVVVPVPDVRDILDAVAFNVGHDLRTQWTRWCEARAAR